MSFLYGFLSTCKQAFTNASRVETLLVLSANCGGALLTFQQVGINTRLSREIISKNRIHVGERQRRILLHDFFGSCSHSKCTNDCVKRDTRQ